MLTLTKSQNKKADLNINKTRTILKASKLRRESKVFQTYGTYGSMLYWRGAIMYWQESIRYWKNDRTKVGMGRLVQCCNAMINAREQFQDYKKRWLKEQPGK